MLGVRRTLGTTLRAGAAERSYSFYDLAVRYASIGRPSVVSSPMPKTVGDIVRQVRGDMSIAPPEAKATMYARRPQAAVSTDDLSFEQDG